MPRDYRVYLEDIREAIARIGRYTVGLSFAAFSADEKSLDAVIRNLEIIGEAAKSVPDTIRAAYPQVEWKKIAGLRDILAHHYFDVDLVIIWDILQTKLPTLAEQIEDILAS